MNRRNVSTRSHGLPPLPLRGWLRYDVVRRAVTRIAPNDLLEIGCGQGALGARLARVADYTGVEPDDESFATAHARITARGGTVLHGTHATVAGKVFDLVCAFEVLEHLEDDRGALEEWLRLVRPGGYLMLSVPAYQDRFGAWDTYAGHYRRYSPDEISQRLASVGLMDIDVVLYGWPITYPTEAMRNRIASRRLRDAPDTPPSELTAASGRRLQPERVISAAMIAVLARPFAWLQRAQRKRGTGLVVVARRPL